MNANFNELIGKTLKLIVINYSKNEMKFICSDGTAYIMYHDQDCCESVKIEDIIGNLEDLIGSEIIMSEELEEECTTCGDSGTWTFYKLATPKGYVTIRWLGESNGYYSESVTFKRWYEDDE
jgi:hypothetical protein